MIWYKSVIEKLHASGLFGEVGLIGAKVRASLDETRFLDIYFDPATRSYSYALIDLTLAYPGDKRLVGWDDYPHEGVTAIEQLESYPHHFQEDQARGIILESHHGYAVYPERGCRPSNGPGSLR